MSKLAILPLLVLGTAGGAVGGYAYKGWQTPDMPDGQALRLPAELKLKAGDVAALTADSVGRKVKFASAQNLATAPRDDKSCWVFGHKPGRYQVMAWSAVGEYPTDPVVCTVIVEDEGPPPPPKTEDKQANMEARR